MNSYETEETAEITAKRSAFTSVFFSVVARFNRQTGKLDDLADMEHYLVYCYQGRVFSPSVLSLEVKTLTQVPLALEHRNTYCIQLIILF